ncbi:hypothetical protein Tco_0462073 [Tanacetum coccineum]
MMRMVTVVVTAGVGGATVGGGRGDEMRVMVAYGGGDEGVVVVVEDEARGGAWGARSGRWGMDLSFYKFWWRPTAATVAGSWPEKMVEAGPKV